METDRMEGTYEMKGFLSSFVYALSLSSFLRVFVPPWPSYILYVLTSLRLSASV